MNAPILLKKFNHVIFPSPVITEKGSVKADNDYDYQALSLSADINFEQGTFEVKGDWHFLMTCNKHTQPEWFNYYTNSVHIDGSIYPSFTIDLSDDNNDGTVFILEGNIRDTHNNVSACSGLLALNKIDQNNNLPADTWDISFYLYDNGNEDCEIAFKIPVFDGRSNTKLN